MSVFDRNLILVKTYINELISSNLITLDEAEIESVAGKIISDFTQVYGSDIFRNDYLYLLRSYSYKKLKMLYK